MTTIAYKDGVLASDSRLTRNEIICTDKCKKIWRLKDGTLFAAAGDNEGGLAALNSLIKGLPLPRSDRDYTAVRILPKGQIYTTEGVLWDRWPEKFIAIGSGGQYANAAMRAGATAVNAVKIAMSSDVYSGGRVQNLRLQKRKTH